MTDVAWTEAALTSARPQVLGALLRYFRDLDTAEEAFQEACLRALKTWPQEWDAWPHGKDAAQAQFNEMKRRGKFDAEIRHLLAARKP